MSGQREAEILARRIRAFWARNGKSPRVWAEQQRATASVTDDRWFWVVRSDMRGGWPKAGPPSPPKIVPGAKSDSPSRIVSFAAIGQRRTLVESVAPSIGLCAGLRVWQERQATHG